jgi:hypothetical protein
VLFGYLVLYPGVVKEDFYGKMNRISATAMFSFTVINSTILVDDFYLNMSFSGTRTIYLITWWK